MLKSSKAGKNGSTRIKRAESAFGTANRQVNIHVSTFRCMCRKTKRKGSLWGHVLAFARRMLQLLVTVNRSIGDSGLFVASRMT